MTFVASRELRNETRKVLDRVQAGEDVIITVDGRPVAVIKPLPEKRRSIPTAEVLRMLEGNRADPGLLAELAELMPDSTDDIPWR
jgi:prevent-host-death family protein